MRYIVEAENPDGTFSTVARFDWPGEMEQRLEKAAFLEGQNPFGSARPLSVWDKETATLMATWEPLTH
jgi:hypothetical protein